MRTNLSHLELATCAALIAYLVLGLPVPEVVATMLAHPAGQFALVALVGGVAYAAHPGVAVLAAVAAAQVWTRSGAGAWTWGSDADRASQRREADIHAFNQFPYTLEQEMVALRAPLVGAGMPVTTPTYKPVLDTLHDATPVST